MSEGEVSNMKTKPSLVPLGTLLGRELRNNGVEKPSIKYGQAALAKRGEDLFLIKPDCQRIPGNASTSFSVFAVIDVDYMFVVMFFIYLFCSVFE